MSGSTNINHDVKQLVLRAPDGKWSTVRNPVSDYSWYVCYGSTLLREGFDYYLVKSEGAVYAEKCFILYGQLYFAKNASHWDNQGVAFVYFDNKTSKVYCFVSILLYYGN